MTHAVICLKSILGFLLSERTSGVYPVLFDNVNLQTMAVLNIDSIPPKVYP